VEYDTVKDDTAQYTAAGRCTAIDSSVVCVPRSVTYFSLIMVAVTMAAAVLAVTVAAVLQLIVLVIIANTPIPYPPLLHPLRHIFGTSEPAVQSGTVGCRGVPCYGAISVAEGSVAEEGTPFLDPVPPLTGTSRIEGGL
jgi:hypothetical protein